MSYIKLPASEGIDLTKATVSLWFRIPSETVTNVIANPPPRNGANGYSEAATWPVLQWVCTLLSWGDQPQGTVWWSTLEIVGQTWGYPPGNNYSPLYTLSQSGPKAPSFIGIEVGDKPHVVVQLQGNKPAEIKNVQFQLVEWDIVFIGTPGVSGYDFESLTYEDASWIFDDVPMGISYVPWGGVEDTRPEVKPDQWHHLLISWDVSGSISCGGDSEIIDSDFKMYFALDDKNYDGHALPARWIGDVGHPETHPAGKDPNTIVSDDLVLDRLPWPSSDGYSDMYYTVNGTPEGSFSGTMGGLDNVTELYIPGSPNYTDGARTVNSVYKVEMAELLVFPGVVLDTSKEENRRLFISAPDKNGFQHPTNGSPLTIPYLKYAIGDPAIWEPGAADSIYAPPLFDPSAMPTAIPITGKPATTAAIDFTKCAFNWMMGRNLGTMKGKTETVGNIKSYWPPEGSDPKIQPGDDGGGGGSGGNGGGGGG